MRVDVLSVCFQDGPFEVTLGRVPMTTGQAGALQPTVLQNNHSRFLTVFLFL
jgi:hypothetical protein